MPIVAWLLSKLTSKIALPLLAGLLLTNIASGAALWITRNTLEHRTRDLAAEVKDHAADLATIKAATAEAQAADRQNAVDHETQQNQISAEKQNDLETQLAAARAVTAKWMRSHAAPVVRGGPASGVPSTADAAPSPDSPAAAAVVSAADLDACAIDYTVAKGWKTWYEAEYGSMAAVGAIVPISEAVGTGRRRSDVAGVGAVLPDALALATGSGGAGHAIVRVQAASFLEAFGSTDSMAGRPGQRDSTANDQKNPKGGDEIPDNHSKNFLP